MCGPARGRASSPQSGGHGDRGAALRGKAKGVPAPCGHLLHLRRGNRDGGPVRSDALREHARLSGRGDNQGGAIRTCAAVAESECGHRRRTRRRERADPDGERPFHVPSRDRAEPRCPRCGRSGNRHDADAPADGERSWGGDRVGATGLRLAPARGHGPRHRVRHDRCGRRGETGRRRTEHRADHGQRCGACCGPRGKSRAPRASTALGAVLRCGAGGGHTHKPSVADSRVLRAHRQTHRANRLIGGSP